MKVFGRASAVVLAGVALALLDCAQQPISVPVRSLERSGNLALVCLDPVPGAPHAGYPLDNCGVTAATKPGGSGYSPHLYALVLQTTRGEVAVLDITTNTVQDVDPSTPGFNFLPVGANPIDIVSTPEGTAAFVDVAEANRPGIYALPTTHVLAGGPTLRQWPACSLPERPGSMTLLRRDPSADATCPGDNYAVDTLGDVGDPTHPNGDLAGETSHPGAQKLVVALPESGDLLVVDAQKLLDRTPGSYDPCPIERRVHLRVDLPPSATTTEVPSGPTCPPLPPSTPSPACPVREPVVVSYPQATTPHPSTLAIGDGARFTFDGEGPSTLYVGDTGAPVVHRLDVRDPCSPTELPPLLPTSFDEPNRPVTTTKVALSPITTDGKQFVYAVDQHAGSLMVFDVSEDATSRFPLVRPRPDLFPFTPRDRLALSAPVKDVIFVTQDIPTQNAVGALETGVLCDIRDGAPGSGYKTAPDFSAGAGPRVLRGTFAMAALTSGSVVFIDLDDYDAPCRKYKANSPATGGATLPGWVTGCADESPTPETDAEPCASSSTSIGASDACCPPGSSGSVASGEGSCRVVVRHEVRLGRYLAASEFTGPSFPMFQTFPALTLLGSTFRTDASDEGKKYPKLLGPAPTSGSTWQVSQGGTTITLDADPATADRMFVLPDATEPRSTLDQSWTVTYEGVIPGFDGRVAKLNPSATDPTAEGVFDGYAGFCYAGVHDFQAARVEGARINGTKVGDPAMSTWAYGHTDYVEITSDLLDEADPYWTTTGDACSFIRCRATFGSAAAPTPARSFRIREAYNDRVLVGYQVHTDINDPSTYGKPYFDEAGNPIPAPATVPDATDAVAANDPLNATQIQPECCFPTLATYHVRGQSTWIANASIGGFLHHVTTDPNTGRCVDMGMTPDGVVCDPTFLRRTGRAYEVPRQSGATGPITHDDPLAFSNGLLHFVIYQGTQPSIRDMQFSWAMIGGFAGLSVATGRGSALVAPQELVYHPVLGNQVLVTDGAIQGVVQIDLNAIAVGNVFF